MKKSKYSIEKNKHNNKKGALIHINIDNFKTLNYNLGNVFGDCVLKVFSQAINELVSEIGELGRLGGDDFGLIIHQFNYIKEIEEVCNKIHERLNKPFEINGDSIFLTVSLGIAVFPHDSSEIDELLKFCDFARYKSKQIGKNKCFFFDKKISEEYFRRALIEVELKKSIIDKELSICYQPQIDSLNNRIIGIEALLRWKNNKLGNVSPDEFIPIAESSGFIVQIGKWVFDEVLKDVNVWQNRGYKFNTISINVSPIQIKESDFIEKVLSGCLKNNIKPSIIELEITEGTLMQISKEKIEELKELMNNGISIALDDFGIGYSSLNYLTKLPISTLKIDKSFVDDIKNESNQAVIRCIIELSKTLKYKIITEGVETKEQLNLLKELGCNIIQGYYFSKPLPQDEIEDLLKLYVV
ncbi:putative bifunctional diguanylate cyclase/phosphodiesterase [Clostridium saccharoperbutylacetonicum]|uniref:putative bifunctional diguanylate cyclase/phosphodiesterase n=1 Tax=Clostridium saccharoperbutylacetonicum TaxID=36745 RepID=UPI00034A5662|nr:bifunctional diguanylate cyclase/phosphodiesterase [Clostridium saccharoperbutylacetonicum]